MYEELFGILNETKSEPCREVIISHFRDLDELKQNDAVKRLLTMYEDKLEMLTPFIETFTEMCIDDETKSRISSLVQHLLESNCDAKLYPGIVKYLFYYMQSPRDIVDNLRSHLKWKTDKNTKLKVIQLLEQSVRRQKSKISDEWMKVVSSLDAPEDLKIIDFIMMLVTLSVKEEKFPMIKKILVHKVPSGFFNAEYLEKAFKIFPSIIAQYSDTLLEMLSALQKNNIYEINEFSSTCFKELFTDDHSDKKEIIGTLVKFLCEKTPENAFFSKSISKMETLKVFDDITKHKQSAEALLVNYQIILRVLDKSKVKLTTDEHRMVMELLCKLAYSTQYNMNRNNLEQQKLREDCAALREHLEMMVNKLLCNPDIKIKQFGIIGAIKIVGSLVVNVHLSSECINIENIPDGPIRDATERVMFILKSVEGDACGLAMVYDEITLEFQAKREETFVINDLFLEWLYEIMHTKLDNLTAFGISKELPDVPGIKLAQRFSVETDNFSQPNVAINLGSLVFHQKNEEIVAVPALFQLTRLLSQHRNHDLSHIYVFLVMPIILTDNFATFEDDLCQDKRRAKQQLDLYFHCANWLREIVGTYCHWDEESKDGLMNCVIQRVKQLIKVEKRIVQLLKEAPSDYYPPPASFLEIEVKKKVFDSLRKEKKVTEKPPKKIRIAKDATIANATHIPPEEATETSCKLRQFFRKIDPQVILLLSENFKFVSAVDEKTFGLNELTFLLDDAHSKIATALNARSGDKQSLCDPICTVRQLNQNVLPSLVIIFHGIRGELETMSQKADEDDSDNVFFTSDANLLKVCFCLILQTFEVVLSCPKLKLKKYKELLVETLTALVPEGEIPSTIASQDQICMHIIEHYDAMERRVKNCESAVALVKFLKVVSSSVEQRRRVHKLCECFLKKEWRDRNGDYEKGLAFNNNLEKILQIFVDGTDLDEVSKLIGIMSEDFKHINSKELKFQKTFPSFNQANSIIMLRVYMARLSQIVGSTEPHELKYAFWQKFVKTYDQLKPTIKSIHTQNIYCCYLKNFLIFIRVFNVHGVAVLKELTGDKKKFIELVRNYQEVTRFGHGVSCDLQVSISFCLHLHAIIIFNYLQHKKNKAVVSIVPKLREALTKSTQIITKLLPIAKIPPSAITMGALKNYDAFGRDIQSQNSTATSAPSDDEEIEQMEVSDDDTIGNLENMEEESGEARHASFRSRSTIM